MIKISNNDMFSEELSIRVNTVNCVGVMGKGIALEFKKRYPGMFSDYQNACKNKELNPGKLHIWSDIVDGTVVNFPTKDHWKGKSKYEYIDSGLDALYEYLQPLGKVSIGIPALGCGLGGLDWEIVEKKIFDKLNGLEADIYIFPPHHNSSYKNLSKMDTLEEVSKACKEYDFEFIEDLYYSAGSKNLNDKVWITLIASKDLAEPKELNTIELIAKELKLITRESKKKAVINLIYNNKKTELLIDTFIKSEIGVNLILPFGFTTRPKIVQLRENFNKDLLSISSIVNPYSKWTKDDLKNTLGFLQERSEILIVSNPSFDWKYVNSPNSWKDIIAIKYTGSSIPPRINTLGRKKSTDSPNLDFLKNLMQFEYSKDEHKSNYNFNLSKLPKEKWSEVFSLITSSEFGNISFNIEDNDKKNIQEFIEEFKIIITS